MTTTVQRIQQCVQRHKISWGDVIQRVAADARCPAGEAADLVARVESGVGCPAVVAIAVFALIADKNSEPADSDHLLAFIEQHRLAVSPQTGGGWVIDDGEDEDVIEIARTRGSLREAIITARTNKAQGKHLAIK